MKQRHTAPRTTAILMLSLGLLPLAQAWQITLNQAPRRVYLHVGNGSSNGDNGTINVASVSVPAGQLGNGSALAMTSDSTQSTSLAPGSNPVRCPDPSTQVLIGASYRRNNAGGGTAPMSATLSVTSPPVLSNASGETIPISEVSWTVSAPGHAGPEVIPAGTFNGGLQFLATVQANTYIENCHSFWFANSSLRAAGTYTARVTYTMTSP